MFLILELAIWQFLCTDLRMIMLMETCTDVELDEFLLAIGTVFLIYFKETFFFSFNWKE